MLDDKTKQKYFVVKIESTEPPEGMSGANWYRYVIGQGNSRIEGKKPGSLEEVTEHAKTTVEHLNSRAGKKASSPYTPTNRRGTPSTSK